MSKAKKVVDIIFWIIFLISFVPYLYLIFISIVGGNTSLFASSGVSYGFEPMLLALILFSTIFPVYPVCALYEIIYAIARVRKSSALRKKISIILASSVIALIILPCTFHEIRNYQKKTAFYNENLPLVNQYLSDNFSPEFVSSCTIPSEDVNIDSGSFTIVTDKPYYEDFNRFTVFVAKDGSLKDNILIYFTTTHSEEKFQQLLDQYVTEKLDLPENMQLGVNIKSVDYTNFKLGDDIRTLLPYVDYEVRSLIINQDEYDEESTFSAIANFLKTTYKELDTESNDFNFYVKVDGEYYASLYSSNVNSPDGLVPLYISGYDGVIPRQNTELDLKKW